jgi:hypothetical protein
MLGVLNIQIAAQVLFASDRTTKRPRLRNRESAPADRKSSRRYRHGRGPRADRKRGHQQLSQDTGALHQGHPLWWYYTVPWSPRRGRWSETFEQDVSYSGRLREDALQLHKDRVLSIRLVEDLISSPSPLEESCVSQLSEFSLGSSNPSSRATGDLAQIELFISMAVK